MKKLLLLVLLPVSVVAGDKCWEKWAIDTTIDIGKKVAVDLTFKALGEIQRGIHSIIRQRQINRLMQEQENRYDGAIKEARIARILSEEEKAGQEFDHCLNESARCHDLTSLGIPRRCNSPARRYSLYNAAAAEARIATFKQRAT